MCYKMLFKNLRLCLTGVELMILRTLLSPTFLMSDLIPLEDRFRMTKKLLDKLTPSNIILKLFLV